MAANTEIAKLPENPRIHPESKLLSGVQKILSTQLEKEHQQNLKILQENEEKGKEFDELLLKLGIELFNAQKIFLELQKDNENCDTELSVEKQKREESEKNVKDAAQELEKKKKDIEEHENELHRLQKELNELQFSIQESQKHNKNVSNEIKIRHREVCKELEGLKSVEKEKAKQDFLIERLQQEKQELEYIISLYHDQVKVQTEETNAARVTLKEAQASIQSLVSDNKNVLKLLNSSILDLKRRDEALYSIKKMLKNQEEKESCLATEISSTQKELCESEDRHECITRQLKEKTERLEFLEYQTEVLKKEEEHLSKQRETLTNTLHHLQSEATKVKQTSRSLENQIQSLNLKIERSIQENDSITSKILAVLSEQSSSNRVVANNTKDIKEYEEKCLEIEHELDKIENMKAKLQHETVEVEKYCGELENDMKETERIRLEKEKLVTKYSNEKKRGQFLIDRSQQQVDKLNKQYDEIRLKNGNDNACPLEAQVKSLKKKIAQTERDGNNLQNKWLKKQTELITIQNKISEIGENLLQKKDEALVFQQKKMRLTASLHATQKEVKQCEVEINEMRKEICSIQQIAGNQKKRIISLEESIIENKEKRDIAVHDFHSESDRINQLIEHLQSEKKRLEERIVESEELIAHFERKILLEKEMQQALDPSVGQAEITSMKRDIHQMKITLDKLKKDQEQIIKQMEKRMNKREFIQLKNIPKKAFGSNNYEKVTLQRQLSSMKAKIKVATEQAASLTKSKEDAEEELSSVKRETDKSIEDIRNERTNISEMRLNCMKSKLEKMMSQAKLRECYAMCNILRGMALNNDQDNGKAKELPPSKDEIRHIEKECQVFSSIFELMSMKHPEFESVFSALQNWNLSILEGKKFLENSI